MKTKSFFAILTVIGISAQLSSQTIPDKFTVKKSGYLSLSYSVGLAGNIKTNGYNDKTRSGYNFSVDASYIPERNIGFFVNYTSTNLTGNLNYNSSLPAGMISPDTKFHYGLLSAGPRFYTNNKKLFADAGVGFSNIGNRKSLGFSAGLGGKIKFNDSYGVILNGRIYNAFVGNLYYGDRTKTNDAFMYYGLYAGFEINDSKQLTEDVNNKKSKISLAALGGKNNYDGGIYAFGVELSLDIKKNFSLISNYFFSRNESLNLYYYKSRNVQSDFSGGARIYFGENNLKLFLESLAGFYVTKTDIELPGEYFAFQNSASVINIGLNFGAGTEFKIINPVSGLIKFNVQNYFRGGTYSGMYGGLKYRF
ncbi:MAG: hypothetical protein ABI840_04085 [bacterium]